MNPGYVMIDCKGLNLLADSAQTITGLYDDCIEAINSGKPVIGYNIQYGEGVPMTPINVFAIVEAGTVIFTASILQVRVASNDSVTIENLIIT